MSDASEKKINNSLMFVLGLLIALFGWTTNKTLNNIDESIKSIKDEVSKVNERQKQYEERMYKDMSNHETRIQLLEQFKKK